MMAPTQVVPTKLVVALAVAAFPVVGGSITSVFQLSRVSSSIEAQGSDIKELKSQIAAIREEMARFQERQDANTKGRTDHEERIRRLERP